MRSPRNPGDTRPQYLVDHPDHGPGLLTPAGPGLVEWEFTPDAGGEALEVLAVPSAVRRWTNARAGAGLELGGRCAPR